MSKKSKLVKLKKMEGDENNFMPNPVKSGKISRSLDRCGKKKRSYDLGQRSKSLNHLREGRSKRSNPFRAQSRSPIGNKRKRKLNLIADNMKEACIACKTDLFDQRRERGRTKQSTGKVHQKTKQKRICPHAGKELTAHQGSCIQDAHLCHFVCAAAVSQCLLLERALYAIVQMLLVRSGIETNPGPTNETDSPCCNASQHFNRVKNTMTKAQTNFQSKVTSDTLSKKVIQIEETGNYGLLIKL